MNYTNNKDISIEELFWEIIQNWRMVIIFSLTFALILSGLTYIKDTNNYENMIKNQDENEEDTLTSEELNEIVTIKKSEEFLKNNINYITDSKLMNIDPYCTKVAIINYYIDSDYTSESSYETPLNNTNNFVNAYVKKLKSENLAKIVSECSNEKLDLVFAKELIKIYTDEDAIFTVEIVYDDILNLNDMIEKIKAEIEETNIEINQSIGSHNLKFLSEHICEETDFDLATMQKDQMESIYNLNEKINVLKSNLNEKQLKALEEEYIDENTLEISKPVLSKKYALIGGVLGITIACILVALRTLFSTKLTMPENILKVFNVKLLGYIKKDEEIRKRLFCHIDKMILKLKDGQRQKADVKLQIELLAGNIQLIWDKYNEENIYLTSSNIEYINDKIVQDIVAQLQKYGFKVKLGTDILENISSLKEMIQMKNVIIVEKLGCSKYSEIERELNKIRELEVNLLGGVII